MPTSNFCKHRSKEISQPKRHKWAQLSHASSPRYSGHRDYLGCLPVASHWNMGQNQLSHSIDNVLLKVSLVNVLFIQFTFLYIFQVKFTCSTSQNKCYTAAALIIMKRWKAFRISEEATPCFSHAGLILASTRVRISNKNKEFEFWKWAELQKSKSGCYDNLNIKYSFQSDSSKSNFSPGFYSILHCTLQFPKCKAFTLVVQL